MRGWTPHSPTKQQRWWDSTTSPTPTPTPTPPSSLAQDAVVLEQVSAINCSGFTDESLLPSHLETRFRNLKSFPPSKTKALTFSSTNNQSPNLDPSKHNPNEKPEQGSVSSPNFSPSKHNPNEKPDHGNKVPNGTLSLRSSNSPSPPRRKDCLWFSPKKKSKENWGDDHLLSELGSFSRKEQQKMPKKAMKEEEKVSREAEKIVQWAKQESARFNLGDQLSD
ncbi:hypothetical protein JHK87_025761 [Glycine soja]|nr:hypothetical protein JHK87_025761 [Glycine soja]